MSINQRRSIAKELGADQNLEPHRLPPGDLAELKPRSKLWIERNGEVVMSDWRMAILEAIDRTGSLAKAAEELGVPYRSAWQKIKESEERLGIRLVDTRSGGADGGSSQLTEDAHLLLRRYRHFSEGIAELVDRRFRESFG